jgi:hypothetical protein
VSVQNGVHLRHEASVRKRVLRLIRGVINDVFYPPPVLRGCLIHAVHVHEHVLQRIHQRTLCCIAVAALIVAAVVVVLAGARVARRLKSPQMAS